MEEQDEGENEIPVDSRSLPEVGKAIFHFSENFVFVSVSILNI